MTDTTVHTDDAGGDREPSRIRRTVASLGQAAQRYGARALRWLVVGIILIAAIIGLLFITRGTAVRRVRGVGGDGAPVAPGEPAFPLSVALLTGTPRLAGNRVELALDGDGTFPRLWADLRSEEHTSE